jgi:hypothetical protein
MFGSGQKPQPSRRSPRGGKGSPASNPAVPIDREGAGNGCEFTSAPLCCCFLDSPWAPTPLKPWNVAPHGPDRNRRPPSQLFSSMLRLVTSQLCEIIYLVFETQMSGAYAVHGRQKGGLGDGFRELWDGANAHPSGSIRMVVATRSNVAGACPTVRSASAERPIHNGTRNDRRCSVGSVNSDTNSAQCSCLRSSSACGTGPRPWVFRHFTSRSVCTKSHG